MKIGSSWVLLAVAFAAGQVRAAEGATTEAACKRMTEKLAAQADISYGLTGGARWSPSFTKGDMGKNVEHLVLDAFSVDSAKFLDSKWPGFFEWSTMEVLKAWTNDWYPKEIATRGYLDCLLRFSRD